MFTRRTIVVVSALNIWLNILDRGQYRWKNEGEMRGPRKVKAFENKVFTFLHNYIHLGSSFMRCAGARSNLTFLSSSCMRAHVPRCTLLLSPHAPGPCPPSVGTRGRVLPCSRLAGVLNDFHFPARFTLYLPHAQAVGLTVELSFTYS